MHGDDIGLTFEGVSVEVLHLPRRVVNELGRVDHGVQSCVLAVVTEVLPCVSHLSPGILSRSRVRVAACFGILMTMRCATSDAFFVRAASLWAGPRVREMNRKRFEPALLVS